MRQQVLGAPRQLVHPAPFEPRAEAARESGAEIAAVQGDALESRALHRRQQFAARRFDFRQFRQGIEDTEETGELVNR